MDAKRLTHVERHQKQCDAEDKEELRGFNKEVTEFRATKASENEATEWVRRYLDQKHQRRRQRERWRWVAHARDNIDIIVEQLRQQAQPFKRPHSEVIGNWKRRSGDVMEFPEEDFADIDTLASSLKCVVEALIRYEALTHADHGSKGFPLFPLDELVTALVITAGRPPFGIPSALEKLAANKKRGAPILARNAQARQDAKLYRKIDRELPSPTRKGLEHRARRVQAVMLKKHGREVSTKTIKRALHS